MPVVIRSTSDASRKPSLGQIASGAYRAHREYPRCVGHWLLGEGGGPTAHDLSRFRNDGSINNPEWVQRQAGPALSFNGTDQYVQVPSAGQLSGFDDFTVSFWFCSTTISTGYFVAVYNPGTSQRAWAVIVNATDFFINLSTDGVAFTGVALMSHAGLEDGFWHHIVYRRSGSTVTAYRDGILGATDTFGGTLHASSANLTIGCRSDLATFATAKIDDVRLWSAALGEPASLFAEPYAGMKSEKPRLYVPPPAAPPPVNILFFRRRRVA